MRQNAFGGRSPLGKLERSPDPLAAIGGGCLLLREKEGKEMGKGKEGMATGREEGEGKEGKGGPPSRIAKVQRWQP